MRLVVIESPFAGATPELEGRNRRYLRACLRDCILRDESPYASHGLLTQEGVLRDNITEERTLGIRAGFAWRRVADGTVVYEDLGRSTGMIWGIEDALKLIEENSRPHTLEFRKLGGIWTP